MYQKSLVTDWCTTELCSSTEPKKGGVFLKMCYIYSVNKYLAVAVVTDGGNIIPKEKLP